MSVLNVDKDLETHFAKAPENETNGFMAEDTRTKTCLSCKWYVWASELIKWNPPSVKVWIGRESGVA